MIGDTLLLYRRLLPFVKPYWRLLLLASVCMIPLSLCSAAVAYLVKPMLDSVFIEKNLRSLTTIPLALLALYMTKGIFDYIYNYLLANAGNRIVMDLRNRIYSHLQQMSLSFFMRHPTGMLMSRITNDVNIIQRAVNTEVTNIFNEALTLLCLAGVLFMHDPRMALLAMLLLPWALLPIMRFGRKSHSFSTRSQKKIGVLSVFMHETITGGRIVKAFGMENYVKARFAEENARLLRIRLKRIKIRALSAPATELIGGCAGAAVIFYGGMNVIDGNATPGTFFSFVAALLLCYGPIRLISRAYQDIQEGLAAARRVFEILDMPPDITDADDAQELPACRGAITFRDVAFSYDTTPVLRNINLRIVPGETVAIVGKTGSGKTTLVNLVPRFFDIDAGSICIDGHDVRSLTQQSLRSQIALVSQHPMLFNDTVHNNIAYGDPERSAEDITRAARDALAHDFISRLPEGYQTIVGEQGVKLSGGQRQRLTIARAMLKDAPILILDEATASLDSSVEKQIQESLQRLTAGRTTLVISHRLSTIIHADRIVVLADGTVVETGTHAELLARGGEYARLYRIYLHEEQRHEAQRT